MGIVHDSHAELAVEGSLVWRGMLILSGEVVLVVAFVLAVNIREILFASSGALVSVAMLLGSLGCVVFVLRRSFP